MDRAVKTNLAKLLATENLTVEHNNVETASFDVINRVLTLPIWEVSDHVYDMLVGHEVGHALYTPTDFFESGIPGSFVNIVEDARIERMMKSSYPGLTKSFSSGYKELNQKDFFEINGKDLKREYTLIDRINLYFKLGIHDVTCIIPFEAEELPYVEMCRNTQSFDDVVKTARAIYDYMKSKQTEDSKEDVNLDNTDDLANNPVQTSGKSESSSVENSQPTSSGDEEKETEKDQEEGEDQESSDPQNEQSEDFDVKTESAFNRRQQELISPTAASWTYITPPECEWEHYITPNADFVNDMKLLKNRINTKYILGSSTNVNYGEKVLTGWQNSYAKYKKESSKSVSFLVKEFEMKKSAKEYNRSFVSKTGVLDTNKIHSYKWNEDLFKKTNVIPSGKNHGLVMFVDWSGSMHTNIMATMKQLFNLVQFCKKVNIPFEVYSFTDNNAYDTYEHGKKYLKCSSKVGSVVVSDGYHLIQLFSSDKKSARIDEQMESAWTLVNALEHDLLRYKDVENTYAKYEMGSTPLNETIFAAVDIYRKFTKKHNVEKVNTVFLTDGESNWLSANTVKTDSRTGEEYTSRRSINNLPGSVVSFKDPETGYHLHKLYDYSCYDSWQEIQLGVTSKLLEYYRWVTNSNVIGYRICTESPRSVQLAGSYDQDEFRRIWKKNGYVIETGLGYNELYVLKVTRDFNGDNEEIKANGSSTQSKLRNEFRKHIKSKAFNKIILSKFVSQIA